MMKRYEVIGQPSVLKNSKRISKVRGRIIVRKSAKAERIEKAFMLQLRAQHRGPTITVPIYIKFLFYGAWKAKSGNLPDLSNLFEAPQDCLQKAGVIQDDRQIESLDGSRRYAMCDTCNLRLFYLRGPKKGQRKPDCGQVKKCSYERTEIIIQEYENL